MPFQFIENESKTISKTTLNKYKICLNKLSELGFESKSDLLENPADVIQAVDELASDRGEAMYFYSAIFYIIGKADLKESAAHAAYYNEFNKYKTAGAKTVVDGKFKRVPKKKIESNIQEIKMKFQKENEKD